MIPDNPAKFSKPILGVIRGLLVEERRRLASAGRRSAMTVLDPCAGLGGIHAITEGAENSWLAKVIDTRGIEIEREWADAHPRNVCGDSTTMRVDNPVFQRRLRKESWDVIATSPTYGNRMADHHNAQDPSDRVGYKFALGHELHPHNSGQMYFWQDSYRDLHTNIWLQCDRLLRPRGLVILNVSDFSRTVTGQIGGIKHRIKVWYQVVAWHRNVFERMGYVMESFTPVPTQRMRNGANRDDRAPFEVVMSLRKLTGFDVRG